MSGTEIKIQLLRLHLTQRWLLQQLEWAHDFSDFSWEDHPICEECTNKRLMKEGQA